MGALHIHTISIRLFTNPLEQMAVHSGPDARWLWTLRTGYCHDCNSERSFRHGDSLQAEAAFNTAIGQRASALASPKQDARTDDQAELKVMLCQRSCSTEVSMPARKITAQRASGIVEDRRRPLGRTAVAVCSCFVLLALIALANHVHGVVVKLSFSLQAEAAFNTAIGQRASALASPKQDARTDDQAELKVMLCQRLTNSA